MGGWRDVEGRTGVERRQANAETERKALLNTARYGPASLLKALLGFVSILALVFALILAMR